MAVAVNVLSGAADTGLGIMAAARALGLDFIPVVTERYDLVVPETTWADERFQKTRGYYPFEEFKTAVARPGRL